MEVQIIAEEGCYPVKKDGGNAGWDLFAAETKWLDPNSGVTISLGIKTAFDPDYVALLWDRSGIACNHEVHRFAGVIDSNYRGVWKVKLFNHSDCWWKVNKGDKIIQALFQRVEDVKFTSVDVLPESFRNEKGFGSSGV